MASSSIRQPDDVFVSVAPPSAPGARSVGASAAWKLVVELFDPTANPIADGDDGGGNGAGEDELAWPVSAAERVRRSGMRARRVAGASTSAAALCANPTARSCSASSVGELGRGGDAGLERRTAIGCERAVGKRRQLDDVPIVELLVAGAVHRHAISERYRAESSHTSKDSFAAEIFPRPRM